MNLKYIRFVGTCLIFMSAMPCMAKLYWNGQTTEVDPDKISKRSSYKTKLNTKMVRVRENLGVSGIISSNEIRSVLLNWANDNDTTSHRFDSSVAAIESAIGVVEYRQSGRLLDQMSNGQHSFRNLGKEYFVACKMKKVPKQEAKLIFFNHELAQKLRLKLPTDPAELESIILERFGVLTQECDEKFHDDPDTMFATRYMDSVGKNPEEDAMGDGRAVWSGEIMANIDGRRRPVDVVLKGVGKTSLEWQGHKEESHKDGLQSTREGIHSYIISKINQKNHIDSTQDLAVIELTHIEKNDQKYGNQPATITVRLGQQVRMGHLSYWSMDETPRQYTKMFNYSVNRALNRSVNAPVDVNTIARYLELFVRNLAIESARYNDLLAVHGSITRGNRTTEGLSIDNGTWQYLDGHHVDFATIGSQFGDQSEKIRLYIDDFFLYTQRGNPDLYEQFAFLKEKSYELFDKIYEESLFRFRLKRIGYSDDAIEKMSAKPSVKIKAKELVQAYNSLLISPVFMGMEDVCGKSIIPAMYDMRSILSSMVSYMDLRNFQIPEDTYSAFEKILDVTHMNLWGVAGKKSISDQLQQILFGKENLSELYRFADTLMRFQNEVSRTLKIRLDASETSKINIRRPNKKTGRHILALHTELLPDFSGQPAYMCNESVAAKIENIYVDQGCTPSERIPDFRFDFFEDGTLSETPVFSQGHPFQGFGGSKARGDSFSKM